VPTLTELENRTVPSVLTVTSNADSGPGSLRDTIAAGANGGLATGGAIDIGIPQVLPDSSSLTVTSRTISGNLAQGGIGGTGGNGGNGFGGGIYIIAGTSASITSSAITANDAVGGEGEGGGSDGLGIGGGVYDLGSFTFDVYSVIAHNHASTTNDNVFP
jgi:hypothetical protein